MIRLYHSFARLLLPREFFREYGVELEDAVRARCARAGSRRARVLLIVRESLDLLRTGLRERWRAARDTRSGAHAGIGPMGGPKKAFDGSVSRDVRFAIRGLFKSPIFTATTVLTLALGIGAVASIFAVADALLFRPLPYANGWVQVEEVSPENGVSFPISPTRLQEFRGVSESLFDGWVAYRWAGLARTDGARTENVDALALGPETGRHLGIRVVLGRDFSEEDGRPGAPAVALLTSRYWNRLGRDPRLVGSTIRLEGQPVTVIGVLEGGTAFPPEGRDIDLWIPLRSDFTFLDRRAGSISGAWGRMRDGLTFESVRERGEQFATNLSEENSPEDPWTAAFELVDGPRGDAETRQAIRILTATVVTIFLIALVNGVNLFIIRTSERSREIALRVALGASRLRVLRQITIEGVVLGLLGGGAAIALAWGALVLIRGLLPETVTYFAPHAVSLEVRTLLIVFFSALTAGGVLGLIPGARVLRTKFASNPFLQRSPDGRSTRRSSLNGLVIAQVSLSMILVVHAVLLVNSFSRLHTVDLGLEVDRLVLADFEPSPTRYPNATSKAEFTSRLVRALEAQPEIEAVALTNGVRALSGDRLEAEGRPAPLNQPENVPFSSVSENYFRVTGASIVSGRTLEVGDIGTNNVVIDRDLARFLWNDEDPVGRRFRFGEGEWSTVVGVVRELRLLGRDQREGPYQFLTSRDPLQSPYVEAVMRTTGRADLGVPAFQRTLNSVDPQQVYWRARSATDYMASIEQNPRFVLLLVGLLAAVAIALAAFGLYGVLSHSVARRRRELGIRAALGARGAGLRRMVMANGLAAAALGIVLGVPFGLLATGLVERFLYEVPTWDPMTYVASGAVLLLIATIATWIPATRATSVDPVAVLSAD